MQIFIFLFFNIYSANQVPYKEKSYKEKRFSTVIPDYHPHIYTTLLKQKT